jgi:hypothetical protein
MRSGGELGPEIDFGEDQDGGGEEVEELGDVVHPVVGKVSGHVGRELRQKRFSRGD